ncbi:MAG: hypothetical protein H7Y01_04375 [Ferruginibacter sp.]|nr:hypothetical protein [Chitinophagaceae bacterium]
MWNSLLIFFLLILTGCSEVPPRHNPADSNLVQVRDTVLYSASIGAIAPPVGYKRIPGGAGSFIDWLRAIPLKKDKTVYLYNGSLKPNQQAQFAVVDISTGTKDLQQCADAVMRLRAEYLYARERYTDIAFMDFNGKWYKCPDAANRKTFDAYLEKVFGWCGSASLEKQLKPVTDFNNIAAGDVLVQGGFPGHAMLVVDMAVNEKGNKVFMLAQGYQPAQDMHIVNNPMNAALSPWYEINGSEKIVTPEWEFNKRQLRRW